MPRCSEGARQPCTSLRTGKLNEDVCRVRNWKRSRPHLQPLQSRKAHFPQRIAPRCSVANPSGAPTERGGHGAIGLPSPPREISGYYLFNDRGIMSAPTDTLCGWELRTHPMKEMLVETISCILGLQWHPLPKPNWIPEIIPKCLQNESPNYKENRTQKQPKPTPKRFRNSPPNVTKWLHNCFLGGGPFG